ncbi:hypothetical protein A6763_07230 [Aeromonas caviae]|nr:hypothetical protein A6763_07230 [Aeromonas caviae]
MKAARLLNVMDVSFGKEWFYSVYHHMYHHMYHQPSRINIKNKLNHNLIIQIQIPPAQTFGKGHFARSGPFCILLLTFRGCIRPASAVHLQTKGQRLRGS